MHSWGDDNVDWEGIEYAAKYIGENLRRWGRVQVTQYKEKYGSCRVYCHFGFNSLLNITHPGYVGYWVYPKFLVWLDIYIFSKIIPILNPIIIPYQKWLYRKLYNDMIKKYPYLTEEIVSCADYIELLNGL